MSKVFNTSFENSLRVLLLLSVDAQNAKNADMVTALDFIAVYGGCLGISDQDLHGENPYSFCEYSMRRRLIASALKDLVMRGLVNVEKQENGFCYKISADGQTIAKNLDSTYGDDYLIAVNSALSFANGKTERQILAYINERAALALTIGGSNV